MTLKAEREDPIASRLGNRGRLPLVIAGIVAVIIVALVIWLVARPAAPPPQPVVIEEIPAPQPEPQEEEDPFISAAPPIPVREPLYLETVEEEEPEELLPELHQSDDFTRDLLAAQSDSDQLANWLGTDDLIQKSVTVIDSLARGELAMHVLPMEPVPGQFQVVVEQDITWMDEDNFARYDAYVNALTSIPPQALANSFHTLRPLLEMAYNQLGRNDAGLDRRIIAAIDRMLLTPDHNGPFALERESVMYQFADPSLEALPNIQKQLLRIGPDNRAKVKNYLRELRAALLNNGD